MQGPHKKLQEEIVLTAKIISTGIVQGIACLEEISSDISRYSIHQSQVRAEIARLDKAKKVLHENLKNHIRVAHNASEEDMENIWKFHEIMIQDKKFFSRIEMHIQKERKNAEWAIMEEATAAIARFDSMADSYFQARSEDIRDLVKSLLGILDCGNDKWECRLDLEQPLILVTQNLYVTSAVHARRMRAAGYVTESLAVLSHGAILLKGIGIPVLGGAKNLHSFVQTGDKIILDALAGKVIIRPSTATRKSYAGLQSDWERPPTTYKKRPLLTRTRDGTRIHLFANIEHPNQVPYVLRNRLEGIGLFRTEFLVLEKNTVPDEEAQYNLYKSVFNQMEGRPVVVRTLDIGADKQTSELHRCSGRNPAMGVRGIRRHILREPEEIMSQLRAILRASSDRTAHILFPMITNLADIHKAKYFVDESRRTLKKMKISHAKKIRIGVMLEIPSSVFLTRDILQEIDFISIGTNDLLQYFTAADRDNPEVLFYQDAKDLSFVRLLEYLAVQARELNRINDVSICGEIASSIEIIPLLLKIGYRSFSVSPVSSTGVRKKIMHFRNQTAGTEKRPHHVIL